MWQERGAEARSRAHGLRCPRELASNRALGSVFLTTSIKHLTALAVTYDSQELSKLITGVAAVSWKGGAGCVPRALPLPAASEGEPMYVPGCLQPPLLHQSSSIPEAALRISYHSMRLTSDNALWHQPSAISHQRISRPSEVHIPASAAELKHLPTRSTAAPHLVQCLLHASHVGRCLITFEAFRAIFP